MRSALLPLTRIPFPLRVSAAYAGSFALRALPPAASLLRCALCLRRPACSAGPKQVTDLHHYYGFAAGSQRFHLVKTVEVNALKIKNRRELIVVYSDVSNPERRQIMQEDFMKLRKIGQLAATRRISSRCTSRPRRSLSTRSIEARSMLSI